MSQKIQFRRGTNSERTTTIFADGEPVFVTDTETLYVGDGSTAGGIATAAGSSSLTDYNESSLSIIPASGDTELENGTALVNAIAAAGTKTPYGRPLSTTNRFTILLFPGVYQRLSSTYLNSSRYVDIVGVGSRGQVTLVTPQTFVISSGECAIKNLTVHATGSSAYAISWDKNIKNVTLENLVLSGSSASLTTIIGPLHFSGLVMKDCYSYGDTLSYSFLTPTQPLTNCSFINTTFDYKGAVGIGFLGSDSSPYKNNYFENCRFLSYYSTYLFYSDSNQPYSFDDTNLFRNCYFSGAASNLEDELFYVDSPTVPFSAKMQDCYIDMSLSSFYGTMSNTIIDARRRNTPAITLVQNSTLYPTFSNCTIISNTGYPCVTGNTPPTVSSGLFSHCRFNNAVYSGVTGWFGDQFNVINNKLLI